MFCHILLKEYLALPEEICIAFDLHCMHVMLVENCKRDCMVKEIDFYKYEMISIIYVVKRYIAITKYLKTILPFCKISYSVDSSFLLF